LKYYKQKCEEYRPSVSLNASGKPFVHWYFFMNRCSWARLPTSRRWFTPVHRASVHFHFAIKSTGYETR